MPSSKFSEGKRSLDEVLRLLDERGIIAKASFQCCSTCGLSAIESVITERRRHTGRIAGFIFYHTQDQEMLLTTGRCYLAFGGVDLSSEAVGSAVVKILGDHGIKASWDGDKRKRIQVDLCTSADAGLANNVESP